jgi:hypothetical protein
LRSAIIRCQLKNGTYTSGCTTITAYDILDPSTAPGTHFTYTISAASATAFTILAMRGTRAGGNTADGILVSQDDTAGAGGVTRSGSGAFSGI